MSNQRKQAIRGVRSFMKEHGIVFENQRLRNEFIVNFLKSMNSTYAKGEYADNVSHHRDFDNNAYHASSMFDAFYKYCMQYKEKNGLKRTPPKKKVGEPKSNEGFKADWSNGCDVCGQKPIVETTGMCAVCTFGEADAQFELIELGEL